MSQKKPVPDRRILRTKRLLRKALITLALKKGYRHVTIQEVTAQADIGYRTFFRHYSSLDDLLKDVAQSVLDELSTRLALYEPVANLQLLTKKGARLFAYIRKNENIFRVLLSDESAAPLLRPLIEESRANIATSLEGVNAQGFPIPIIANHLIASTFALMRWWIENDFPYPPEFMGQVFTGLIVQPVMLITSGYPGESQP